MNLIKSCPVCNSDDIIEFNGRPNARCNNCGSLERTRYLYLLLNRMGILKPDMSILHLAPEPGLFMRLSRLSRDFKAVDYDTSQYKNWSPSVGFIDLCKQDETLDGKYDLIIHNHVLEHVPCSVSKTLSDLRKRLNKGGVMLFSVPIRRNADTTEDLSDDLSEDDRKRLFGQWDHMRIFGDQDVLKVLKGREKNPVSIVDPYAYLSAIDLSTAFVPETVAGVTGSSIFRLNA